jgi:glycosyltransferase (activator-dependent family)
MKILFVPHANKAHLHVMTPLAWALRTAGHDIRIAGKPDIADSIMAAGFTPVIVGAEMNPNPGFYPGYQPPPQVVMAPGQRQDMPLQEDFPQHEPLDRLSRATWGFALFSTDTMVADLVEFCRNWGPDLVIWDQMVYAAPIAARACGAAQARMLMGPDSITQLRRAVGSDNDPLRDWMQPLLERYGCAFDEEMIVGQWTIDPMPAWQWRPSGLHFVPVRHIPFNPPAPLPSWLDEPQIGNRICLTLGASHRDGRGTEASAADLLAAVSELDAEVVATFNAKQLESIPKIPDNVRAVDFVPLAALLPTCSAIVHHGGAGTFATAISCGVPQLIIPGTHWAFQWWGPLAHANGLQKQGAGLFVADADHLTAEALHEDLSRVLKDSSFRANAERLRVETLGVPTPNEVVPVLERLTAEHRVGRPEKVSR